MDAITSVSKDSIAFKGFGTELPMIFVNQKIELRQSGHASYSDVALVEERRHVYLSSRASVRKARVGKCTEMSTAVNLSDLMCAFSQLRVFRSDQTFTSSIRRRRPPCSGSRL